MSKSGAIFQKVCQKVAYFSEKCVKSDAPSNAWKIVFSKGVPKSDALSQKVCQKVEYFLESDVKKWSTFSKGAPKSDVPIQISGVVGDFSPN